MSIISKVTAGAVTSGNRLRTISHTLEEHIAERLRHFAFGHRLSESSVIEHALAAFLDSAADEELAWTLREAGYGLRRKTG